MEIMGLHTPGSSFVNPGTPLRDALTVEAAKRALAITALGNEFTPVGEMIDERSVVNGVVGADTPAAARTKPPRYISGGDSAPPPGIQLTWEDISDLSDAVPLMQLVYPNGAADVNHFNCRPVGLQFHDRQQLSVGPACMRIVRYGLGARAPVGLSRRGKRSFGDNGRAWRGANR